MKIRVTNPARGQVLCEAADIANSDAARRRGLLGRPSLGSGEGLWILPSDAIHTHGMKFPIDILFLGPQNEVLDSIGTMLPGGNAQRIGAHSVLEVPARTIQLTGTQAGDFLELASLEETRSPDLGAGCYGLLSMLEDFGIINPGTGVAVSTLAQNAKRAYGAIQGVRF